MNQTTEDVETVTEPANELRAAAVEIFTQAKDVYFRESSTLEMKRAELDRVEAMAVTLRGQIAEREALIGGLKDHMHETFQFARAEIERRPA